MGIEPMISSLPMTCFTTKLRRHLPLGPLLVRGTWWAILSLAYGLPDQRKKRRVTALRF